MAPLAFPNCLGLPYWFHQLDLSWHLHQPETHQLSEPNISYSLTDGQTLGPIDRTPGIPGPDKNWTEHILYNEISSVLLFFELCVHTYVHQCPCLLLPTHIHNGLWLFTNCYHKVFSSKVAHYFLPCHSTWLIGPMSPQWLIQASLTTVGKNNAFCQYIERRLLYCVILYHKII